MGIYQIAPLIESCKEAETIFADKNICCIRDKRDLITPKKQYVEKVVGSH